MSTLIADPPPAGNAGPEKVRSPVPDEPHHYDTGWVYLIYCDWHRLFKIGVTRHTNERLTQLTNLVGRRCVFIHAILVNNRPWGERHFHAKFKDRRFAFGGEWFVLSQAAVDLFRSCPLFNVEGFPAIANREVWLADLDPKFHLPPTNSTFEVPA